MDTVDRELGAIARPARVHFVTLLPKTRSGKLLRRSIQALAEGRDPGDLTTIEDPARSSRSAPRSRHGRRAERAFASLACARSRARGPLVGHGSIGDNVGLFTIARMPESAAAAHVPLAEVTARRAVESIHFGSVAVVDRDGPRPALARATRTRSRSRAAR